MNKPNQTLTLIRGLPGSGKSTLARAMCIGGRGFHLEADMFFVTPQREYIFDPTKLREAHHWCLKRTHINLQAGHSVIVSNTFTTKWEMAPYLGIAAELGVPVQLIICQGNFPNIHNVPQETIDRMRDRWEW